MFDSQAPYNQAGVGAQQAQASSVSDIVVVVCPGPGGLTGAMHVRDVQESQA